MNVIFLTLFVSGVLLALGVVGFWFVGGRQEWEQGNRLTLIPLTQDPDSKVTGKQSKEL